MKDPEIHYLEGWYGAEHDGLHPFRWMGKEAALVVKGLPSSGQKILQFAARCPISHESVRRLTIVLNGRLLAERTISPCFMSYSIPFEEDKDLTFEFKLDHTSGVEGDPRDLGIAVREIKVLNLAEADSPLYGEGWYDWESGDFFPFRWMGQRADILLPSTPFKASRYLSFAAASEYSDLRQSLSLALGEKHLAELQLLYRWNRYSLILPSASEADTPFELRLIVNRLFSGEEHPEDARELAIRVGRLEFHNDDQLYGRHISFHRNAVLNYREMTSGKTKLESFPLSLGVDLYGRCNIKPHCVYCLWDWSKEEEGDFVDAVVDEKILESYGPFFGFSRNIINCSIGEPLLHPRLEEVLEFCADQGKMIEISTNGQAFTERTIKAIIGKPIILYLSLDAACRETYAKIRNDRWDSIIPNLRRLAQERKNAGHLPKIHMVFIPMRVNRGDLEAYFRLCRDIEADALVLRPLFKLKNPRIKEDRGGYHFDYEKEILTREELEEVFGRCDEFSIKYGIPVANQFAFGLKPEAGTKRKSLSELPLPRF